MKYFHLQIFNIFCRLGEGKGNIETTSCLRDERTGRLILGKTNLLSDLAVGVEMKIYFVNKTFYLKKLG